MNNFLFIAKTEGSRFVIHILEGQQIEKDMAVSLEDVKITGPIGDIIQYTIGSLLYCTEFSKIEDKHLDLRKFIPVLTSKGEHLPLVDGLNDQAKEMINYVIDYYIDDEEKGLEEAKKFAKYYQDNYSFVIDFDEKMKEPDPKDTKKGNLKRTINGKYKVPKKEDIGFAIDPDLWFMLVRNVLRGENTLLVGPTGSLGL